jgi:hypothetical protein
MKPIIVALLLFASFEDRTRDDWVKLVTELQKQDHKLNRKDRRFLGFMAKWLSLSEYSEPTMGQRALLFDIKRRVEED